MSPFWSSWSQCHPRWGAPLDLTGSSHCPWAVQKSEIEHKPWVSEYILFMNTVKSHTLNSPCYYYHYYYYFVINVLFVHSSRAVQFICAGPWVELEPIPVDIRLGWSSPVIYRDKQHPSIQALDLQHKIYKLHTERPQVSLCHPKCYLVFLNYFLFIFATIH